MNPRSQIIQVYNRFTRTNIGHADKKYFGLVLHSLRTLWFKWFQVEGEWCWLVNSDHHSPPFSWMQTRFKISITSVNGAKKTVRFPQISFLLVLFSVTYINTDIQPKIPKTRHGRFKFFQDDGRFFRFLPDRFFVDLSELFRLSHTP